MATAPSTEHRQLQQRMRQIRVYTSTTSIYLSDSRTRSVWKKFEDVPLPAGPSFASLALRVEGRNTGAVLQEMSSLETVYISHSPSTSMAGSGQYRHLINDYGPPSLGYTQGGQITGSNQVPQSKYAELLTIIEELGKEIRPTYAGSKSAMERLKRGIIHARGLVRECLAETERNARS
ncbi:cyclin-dependent kinase 2-associated protein 1 isoform 2-T2 [Vipera latastei]